MNNKELIAKEPHEEDEVGAFYVKDCATAIQLLQMANKLSHRVYNIGNDAPLNYREFTEVVKKNSSGYADRAAAGTPPTAPAQRLLWTTPVSEKKWDVAPSTLSSGQSRNTSTGCAGIRNENRIRFYLFLCQF